MPVFTILNTGINMGWGGGGEGGGGRSYLPTFELVGRLYNGLNDKKKVLIYFLLFAVQRDGQEIVDREDERPLHVGHGVGKSCILLYSECLVCVQHIIVEDIEPMRKNCILVAPSPSFT